MVENEAMQRRARKRVSTLFCDVVGSTALADAVDAETFEELMGRYFDVASEAIQRHGGTVEKFVGDGVVAVFGIPVVHEDDALRAVRASFDLLEGVELLNRQLEANWSRSIQVRIGINTGEVVAGSSYGLRHTVLGDTMNVAARLQEAAPPGQVLLGPETYRLVKRQTVVEPLKTLPLRGKSQPLQPYLVLKVQPDVSLLEKEWDSPLIGREEEIKRVVRQIVKGFEHRHCDLVIVSGVAGVGKSRLMREVAGGLPIDCGVISGRCLSYAQGASLGPAIEMIRELLESDVEVDEESITTRLRHRLQGQSQADLIVSRLREFLGFDPPTAPLPEAFWAFRKLLESAANEKPLLVLLEDLHWAEPTLLELVQHLARTLKSPVQIIASARPEFLENQREWVDANAVAVPLEPLTGSEAAELVNSIIRPGLPDLALKRVLDVSHGNPFFIEETVAVLVEDGALHLTASGWEVTPLFGVNSAPLSVQSVLAARVDAVPPEEREILDAAAVVGDHLNTGVVADLCGRPRENVDAIFDRLVRKGFLRAGMEPHGEDPSFRHALLREAAYQSIPKGRRAQLHERIAVQLRETAHPLQIEVIAHHLEQSYLYRQQLGGNGDLSSIALHAADALVSAATKALGLTDKPAAINFLERAAALLPPDDARRFDTILKLARELRDVGETGRAYDLVSAAIPREAEGSTTRAWGELVLVDVESDLHYTPTELLVQRVLAMIPRFEELGDDGGLAYAYRLTGELLMAQDRWSEVDAYLRRSIDHARRAGALKEEVESFEDLAWAYYFGPTPVALAKRQSWAVVERARADGRRIDEASALDIVASLQAMEGRIDQARRLIQLAREILLDVGVPETGLRDNATWSGRVELLGGDFEKAEAELRWACKLFERTGTPWMCVPGSLLTHAVYQQGRHDEASQLATWCEASATPEILDQALWRSASAPPLARQGRPEAEGLARDALVLAKQTGEPDLVGDVLMNLADVLLTAERFDEALQSFQRAGDCYEQKGNVVASHRVRASIAALSARSP